MKELDSKICTAKFENINNYFDICKEIRSVITSIVADTNTNINNSNSNSNSSNIEFKDIDVFIQIITQYLNNEALIKKLSTNPINLITKIKNFIVETIWIEGIKLKNQNQSLAATTNTTTTPNNTNHPYTYRTSPVKLKQLVISLVQSNIIEEDILLEKLEEQTLLLCNIINEERIFKQKLNKINTKLYFEQEKFNLIREESEGFAKLVFLLNTTQFNIEEAYNQILSLVGFFDLDANRVIDLIINALIFNREKMFDYYNNSNSNSNLNKENNNSDFSGLKDGKNYNSDKNYYFVGSEFKDYYSQENNLIELLRLLGSKEKITHILGNILFTKDQILMEIAKEEFTDEGLLKSFINNSNSSNNDTSTKDSEYDKIINMINSSKAVINNISNNNTNNTNNNNNKNIKTSANKTLIVLLKKHYITKQLTSIFDVSALLLKYNLISLTEFLPYTKIKHLVKSTSYVSNNTVNKAKFIKAIEKMSFEFKANKNIPFQKNQASLADFVISSGSDNLDDYIEPSISNTITFINNYSFTKIERFIIENDYSNTSNDRFVARLLDMNIYFLINGLVKCKEKKILLSFFELIQEEYDCLFSYDCVESLCSLIDWMISDLYEEVNPMRCLFKKKDKVVKKSNKNNDNTSTKMEIEIDNNDKENINNDNDNNNNTNNNNTNSINNKNSFNKLTSFSQLLPELTPLLSIVKFGLSRNPIILTKLLRIINSNFQDKATSFEKEEILSILKQIILPSISLIEPTNELTSEFWALLDFYPWKTRFQLYSYWNTKCYFTHPILLLKHALLDRDVKKWLKILSKDNIKTEGRALNIITSSNPIIGMSIIITNLINYTNVIDSFLQTLNYCSRIAFDSVLFVFASLISEKSNGEKIAKNDNVNCYAKFYDFNTGKFSSYFKNFCLLVSSVFKKYYFLDFSSMFQYIIKEIVNDTSSIVKLIILREIISKMSGIIPETEMDVARLMSFSGGENLVFDSFGIYKDLKGFKKASFALFEFFQSNSELSSSANKNNNNQINANTETNINNHDSSVSSDSTIGESGYNVSIIDGKNVIVSLDGKIIEEIDYSKDYSIEMKSNISFTSALLFILASKKEQILFLNKQGTNVKQIITLSDEMHLIFLQIINFLTMINYYSLYNGVSSTPNSSLNITYNQYIENINNNNSNSINNISNINSYYHHYLPYKKLLFLSNIPLYKYVLYYKIQPHALFHIVRPCIGSLIDYSRNDYSCLMNEFKTVLDVYLKLNEQQFKADEELFEFDNTKLANDLCCNNTNNDTTTTKTTSSSRTSIIWKTITPEFFFLYFSLKLSDINYPEEQYHKQQEQLVTEINELTETSTTLQNQATQNQSQVITEASRVKKDLDKKKLLLEQLKDEQQRALAYTSRVKSFIIKKNKDLLTGNNKNGLFKYLFMYCFFPRLKFSKLDAIYTAKFICLMLKSSVEYFRVFDLMQKITKMVIPSLVCLSEYEVENLGVFLYELFNQINKWSEEKCFESECYGNVCFAKDVKEKSSSNNDSFNGVNGVNSNGNTSHAGDINLSSHKDSKDGNFINVSVSNSNGVYHYNPNLSYSFIDNKTFKEVIKYIIDKIIAIFKNYLQLNDYISVRNCIIILNKLIDHIPYSKEQAKKLEEVVNQVIETTKESDLSFKLSMYLIKLHEKHSSNNNEEVEKNEAKNDIKKEKSEKKEDTSANTSNINNKRDKDKRKEKNIANNNNNNNGNSISLVNLNNSNNASFNNNNNSKNDDKRKNKPISKDKNSNIMITNNTNNTNNANNLNNINMNNNHINNNINNKDNKKLVPTQIINLNNMSNNMQGINNNHNNNIMGNNMSNNSMNLHHNNSNNRNILVNSNQNNFRKQDKKQ